MIITHWTTTVWNQNWLLRPQAIWFAKGGLFCSCSLWERIINNMLCKILYVQQGSPNLFLYGHCSAEFSSSRAWCQQHKGHGFDSQGILINSISIQVALDKSICQMHKCKSQYTVHQGWSYLNQLIKVYRLTRNIHTSVLELNSAGCWPSRRRIGHPRHIYAFRRPFYPKRLTSISSEHDVSKTKVMGLIPRECMNWSNA